MAREQGLTEEHVEQIDDGYENSMLSERDKTALQLTDAIVGDPRQVPESLQKQCRASLLGNNVLSSQYLDALQYI